MCLFSRLFFISRSFEAGRGAGQRGHILLPEGFQEQDLVGGGQRGRKVYKLADIKN